jgi:hypothetical protein
MEGSRVRSPVHASVELKGEDSISRQQVSLTAWLLDEVLISAITDTKEKISETGMYR